MKSLIITWEKFQDQEVVFPYYFMLSQGWSCYIMSNVVGKFHGIMGVNMTSDFKVSSLSDEFLEYDLLILPGGVKAMEKLRQELHVIEFIKKWHDKDKLILSLCSGPQLLISAKVIKDRKVSAYYSMKDDIVNAGAEYIDAPVVVDGNIVTSPHYDHMGIWMKTGIDLYNEREKVC